MDYLIKLYLFLVKGVKFGPHILMYWVGEILNVFRF